MSKRNETHMLPSLQVLWYAVKIFVKFLEDYWRLKWLYPSPNETISTFPDATYNALKNMNMRIYQVENEAQHSKYIVLTDSLPNVTWLRHAV